MYIVFEDSSWFRYQEIISEKLKNPKCWPDLTRLDPTRPKSGKLVTRPDPTRPAGPSDPWTTLVCPGFLNISPKIRVIRWFADFSKCQVSLWQETPFHCLFQHTLQSTSTLRIKQAPPCLRCVCESGYEGGSSHLPQQRSGQSQTMPPSTYQGHT